MKKIRLILLIASLVVAFAYSTIWAEKDIEIESLIIDQTRTKFGHDFYQSFNLFWEPPPGIESYNILIDEQAEPRLGSWIAVEVNTVLVYRALLKPNPEDIEVKAKEAIEVSKEFLFNWQEYERSLEEEKDWKGSGIY